ncbi:hypothetical protein L7F22_005235 [Adiantum nelumboides]|nr:hypothetical protein [Adiantum nelumboides]
MMANSPLVSALVSMKSSTLPGNWPCLALTSVRAMLFIRSLTCRLDLRMLYLFFEKVIKAGATTIVVGDIVGSLLPHEFDSMIFGILANMSGAKGVVITSHCLCLCLLLCVQLAIVGASQLVPLINGIGERTKNIALQEVMLLCENSYNGLHIGIETRHIASTSKMVF